MLFPFLFSLNLSCHFVSQVGFHRPGGRLHRNVPDETSRLRRLARRGGCARCRGGSGSGGGTRCRGSSGCAGCAGGSGGTGGCGILGISGNEIGVVTFGLKACGSETHTRLSFQKRRDAFRGSGQSRAVVRGRRSIEPGHVPARICNCRRGNTAHAKITVPRRKLRIVHGCGNHGPPAKSPRTPRLMSVIDKAVNG